MASVFGSYVISFRRNINYVKKEKGKKKKRKKRERKKIKL